MAVAWTALSNAQVAAGAALTTALVTALRDNPEGIAQRATGAPKIYGVPYNFQEFLTAGTWTKPSNASTGDRVLIQVVAGGGGGTTGSTNQPGGGGGGGAMQLFDNIDTLPASVTTMTIGAGAVTSSGTGGNSSFGVTGNAWFCYASGGLGGTAGSTPAATLGGRGGMVAIGNANVSNVTPAEIIGGGEGGTGGGGGAPSARYQGHPSVSGGGGGGGRVSSVLHGGGSSLHAGRGGIAGSAGGFPGGGGGGNLAGGGANGVIRVWCFREGV